MTADQMAATTQGVTAAEPGNRPAAGWRSWRGNVGLAQVALAVVILLLWEYLPAVPFLSDRFNFFNRFFISSPTMVAVRVWDLIVGTTAYPSVLSPLWLTVRDALIGLLIGVVAGALVGLVLSSSQLAAAIFQPFVVVFSAVPRIALIPITVVALGPTSKSSIFSAAVIVFFAVFFNAFEGGRSVSHEVIDNAWVLGASGRDSMLRVRLPYVLAWTIVALPGAAGYGLVGAVVTEILVGIPGMGQQLLQSLNDANATTTIALAIMLAVLGVVLTTVAAFIRSKALFWWEGGTS
jgi:NitT/TauT family transport system permease protein